uniref:Uncharacterized protein n=1 Tax=Cyclophora tenuis TaxID=216820 RepID=A0A7S1D4X8_CYCTE
MPDSEVNIKNVKVMMGRGQELEEEDPGSKLPSQVEVQPDGGDTETDVPPVPSVTRQSASSSWRVSAVGGSTNGSNPRSQRSQGAQAEGQQYLVAAAVIEDESPLVQPYKDEILKLIITLPVDGQTQNVQFDFHLVEDDPVQVAREMVTELGIPLDAVLEISGTVSALARQARMKQGEYHKRLGEISAPTDQSNHGQFPPETKFSSGQSSLSAHHDSSESGAANGPAVPPSQGQIPLSSALVDETSSSGVPQSSSLSGQATTPSPPIAERNQHINLPSKHEQPSSSEVSPGKNGAHEESGEDDNEIDEELRKLDEEFQKNLQRTKKVFVNRMDNLHRSKQEKEAQHQKTLEKHEKERLEFEKRVQQEAIEQNRRLEQLKREHDRKREVLAKKQAQASSQNQAQHGALLPQAPETLQNHDRPQNVDNANATLTPVTSYVHGRSTSSDSSVGVGSTVRPPAR